ncbi:hypothetical protein QUB37_10930 [Microcoleus sp. AT3-A2]|uniref:hypothetical protein n=1 Tax=Microcoleus sp. AT3-A2 TaxID=2818610 RepID=UPI002FD70E86
MRHQTIAADPRAIAQLKTKENTNGYHRIKGAGTWFCRSVSKSLSVPLDAAIPPAAKPTPIACIVLYRRSSRFFSANSLLRSSI